MKKSSFLLRLRKLHGRAGSWDAVAELMGSSKMQVLRMNRDDYPLNEKHIQKLAAAEKKAGISRSSTENLLRQMLVDRMALIFSEVGDDEIKFKKLTGLPFDILVLSPDTPLPPCNELRRIAGLASKKMDTCLKEAQTAMEEIEAAKKTISAAQDKLRNLIFYTRQRDVAGLLDEDPLLKVINAFENEQSG